MVRFATPNHKVRHAAIADMRREAGHTSLSATQGSRSEPGKRVALNMVSNQLEAVDRSQVKQYGIWLVAIKVRGASRRGELKPSIVLFSCHFRSNAFGTYLSQVRRERMTLEEENIRHKSQYAASSVPTQEPLLMQSMCTAS